MVNFATPLFAIRLSQVLLVHSPGLQLFSHSAFFIFSTSTKRSPTPHDHLFVFEKPLYQILGEQIPQTLFPAK
jgi:hypothetical protein